AKLFNPLEGIIQAQHSNLNSSNSQQKTEFKKISSVEELDELLNSNPGKPVMFDFYADWCVSCHEMEAFTFNKAPVIESMNQMLLLQADVTKNTTEDRALLKRFNLF